MNMQTTVQELQRIASGRTRAAEAIREAVEAVMRAYGAVEDAHRSSLGLHHAQALQGEGFTELTEVMERLGVVREMVAEIGIALTDLHPHSSAFNQEILALAVVARSGMEQKRLADWETQAFREIVVKALAGEKPTPE